MFVFSHKLNYIPTVVHRKDIYCGSYKLCMPKRLPLIWKKEFGQTIGSKLFQSFKIGFYSSFSYEDMDRGKREYWREFVSICMSKCFFSYKLNYISTVVRCEDIY